MNEQLKQTIRTEVSTILDKEPHRGLIHSVSYYLANTLHHLSQRLIFHNSEDKADRFQEYLDTEGAVFVSPSSIRGLDLRDDMCRFIVFLKCPFLSLNNHHTRQRLFASGKWGKTWYVSQAISNLVQGSGRGMRSEDDFCRVYLLDKQIERLLKNNAKLFPIWFRDAVIYE